MKLGILVPHDPDPTRNFCPTCEEKWPCAERKRQRAETNAIIAYLRSDLYEPVPWEPSHGVGRLWRSPLGWEAWIGYGIKGVQMVVHDFMHGAKPGESDQPWVGTDDADVFWIDRVLP